MMATEEGLEAIGEEVGGRGTDPLRIPAPIPNATETGINITAEWPM